MKHFAALIAAFAAIALSAPAAAFELFLNTGKEGGAAISVLHLKNQTPFSCRFEQTEDLKEFYRCEIEGKSKFISNQDLALFSLNFENRANSLVIYIHPKVPSRLLDASLDLFKTQNVYVNRSARSREFSIEFYPAGFAAKAPNGLDFVVTFKDLQLPYIGALDLDQNPVHISDNNDINLYLGLKKTYDGGDYKRLQEMAERAIEDYPTSVFLNEFYLYRLRALFGRIDQNSSLATDVIDGGKVFMRSFASSQNYTEVVRMMVRSHLKLSQRNDADYYIDILNSEQPDDYFTRLANLDYADFLINHQRAEMAIELYRNILFSAKEPELASRAAYALAKISLASKNYDEAKDYTQKILDANAKFFAEDKSKSMAFAREFFRHEDYETAARLFTLLLEGSQKTDSYYERTLYQLALANSKLKRNDAAWANIAQYRKLFPVGEFKQNIEEIADELYFDTPDENSFTLHEHYRMLMAKYKNHIGARALAEEVKLLFKERDFAGVFELKDEINASKNPELVGLYKQSLKDLLLAALHRDECFQAARLVDELSAQDLIAAKNKPKLLSCLERSGRLDAVFQLGEIYARSEPVTFDLQLARIELDHAHPRRAIKRLEALLARRLMLSDEDKSRLYFTLAPALLDAGRYNDAAAALRELERTAPQGMQLVEVYSKFLGYFKLHNLGISAMNYGQKAIAIQNRLGINDYSPQLEFITLEALIEHKNFRAAEEISRDLAKLRLSDEQAARMHYLRAQSLLGAGGTGAKEAAAAELRECKAGDWKQICDELLETLE